MDKKKGMTLSELMVTVLITGILAAVGYNGFVEQQRYQSAKEGAQHIAYALRAAKQYARTNGVITSLRFNEDNTYDVIADGQSISNRNNVDATSGRLPVSVTVIYNTCSHIGFNVNGALVDDANDLVYDDCSITLGYYDGPRETVVINGTTGEVEYE